MADVDIILMDEVEQKLESAGKVCKGDCFGEDIDLTLSEYERLLLLVGYRTGMGILYGDKAVSITVVARCLHDALRDELGRKHGCGCGCPTCNLIEALNGFVTMMRDESKNG